jgi:monovalent cation:H+ antiporter, CPA1 family
MDRYLLNVFELLIVGILVALAIRQLSFAYTVALVLVGLAMALPQSFEVELRYDLILALSIPSLVFDAARRINLGDLRQDLIRVLVLALPGVILTTLIAAGTLAFFTPLTLPAALVFGALISTTDPFAVGPLLRNFGVPKRLAVLVNGESLLNNGIAIIVFNLAVTTVLTGQFHLLNNLGEFIRVFAGGVAVGLVLGWSISKLVAWGNDNLMEVVLTTLLPFVSYLLAERLQVSGVLAVIIAGLINGTLRAESTSSRPWEFLAFVANSLIFLLMGLQISLPALFGASQAVLWAIVAVILARALVLYGLNGLLQRSADLIPTNWLHVWNWGGLRGAIGMALVLSLPPEFTEYGELLKIMVFGVVLFTVLIQSTTLRALLRWFGVVTQSPEPMES